MIGTLLYILIGIIITTAGGYFANKYTDKRKEQNIHRKNFNNYKELKCKWPCLLKYIKRCIVEKNSISYSEFTWLSGGEQKDEDYIKEKVVETPNFNKNIISILQYYCFVCKIETDSKYLYTLRFVNFLIEDKEL